MTERWITQDKFFDPDKGTRGNCQQAATASLLGLSMDEVPNFMEAEEHFWVAFFKFIHSRGLAVFELSGPRHLPFKHLAYGPSARGVNHAVVMEAGEVIFDPHPSRAGLLEVKTVAIITPADIAEFRRGAGE